MASTLKKKGPASAPTLPSHGSTHLNGQMIMNDMANSTAAATAAREDGPMKVCRLAREISKALNDCQHYQMVIVHPSKDREYPVELCMDGSYRRMTNALYTYRDAVLALADCGGKGVRRLKAERDAAHHELMASFFEVTS